MLLPFSTSLTLGSFNKFKICVLLVVHCFVCIRSTTTLDHSIGVREVGTILRSVLILDATIRCKLDQLFLVDAFMLLAVAERVRCLVNEKLGRVGG